VYKELIATTSSVASWFVTCEPSWVQDEKSIVQFCSSKGKYLTSMAHELRKMAIDNHVTLPSDVTMTFVLIDDRNDDTSAL